MKACKRLISVLVISVLFITQFSYSFGATDNQIKAANQLFKLELYRGYEDGTLRLDNNLTRAQLTALFIRILGYDKKEVAGDAKNFSDVKDKFWAKKDISKAIKLKLVSGYPDGTFKPEKNIVYAEFLALVINVIKKNQNLEGSWPDNYINRAVELGIVKANKYEPNKPVTRGEVAEILWDVLLYKYI